MVRYLRAEVGSMGCGMMKVACDDGFEVVTKDKKELVTMTQMHLKNMHEYAREIGQRARRAGDGQASLGKRFGLRHRPLPPGAPVSGSVRAHRSRARSWCRGAGSSRGFAEGRL